MKDYYSILRVSRSADSQTIKRSYRLLVQRYHPDVNPDPKAAELIKEINEAYDVLGDPVRKREYDYRLVNPYQSSRVPHQETPHRDPRYRKQARPVKEENAQLELIRSYVHLAVKVNRIGCAVCFFLLIDICLPHRVANDTVMALYTSGSGRSTSHRVASSSGQQIKIGYEDMIVMERGDSIEIIRTAITGIPITLYVPEKQHIITSMATLYRTYVFVPLVLLVTSVLGLVIRNRVELQFNFGIVTFVLLIFTLILIFK